MANKIILVYHEIRDIIDHNNYMNTPISGFIQQVNHFLQMKYQPSHLENLLKEDKDGFLITIDDGLEGAREGIRFLEENSIPYGLAIVASKLGKPGFLTARQLKSLKFAEFYSHSLTHKSFKIIDKNSFLEEVYESKKKLEKILKKEIKAYVYPYGEYKDYDMEVLKKYYQFALSLRPFHLNFQGGNLYFLPRVNVHGGYSFQKFKFLVSPLGNLYLHLAYFKRKFFGPSYLKA